MHAILFIGYFILLCLAIKKLRFFRNSELRFPWLLAFFGIRVLASCVHTWIAYRYYPNHGDIWYCFQEGLSIKADFIRDPINHLKNMFPPLIEFSFFDTHSSWYFLQFRFVSGIDAFLDFLSFDDFYVNGLIFSFFTFWGSIALFRVFKEIFHNNGLLCSLMALVIPSTIFWTSCIHKEGVIFLSLGFFHYYLHRALTEKPRVWSTIAAILFVALALFCRVYLFFGLLPGVLYWIAGEKIPLRIPVLTFLILAITTVFFYFVSTFYPNADLFLVISERQQDFMDLSGHSRIYLPTLEPNITSFVSVLPVALLNGFVEPLPGKGGQAIYLLSSLEIMVICLIILFAISRKFVRTAKVKMSVYDISCLFMAIPCILLIGYTVPFVGAIIRYRSIYLPFLLVPFLHTLSGVPIISRINKSLGKMIA